jgi:hypothetical protein
MNAISSELTYMSVMSRKHSVRRREESSGHATLCPTQGIPSLKHQQLLWKYGDTKSLVSTEKKSEGIKQIIKQL